MAYPAGYGSYRPENQSLVGIGIATILKWPCRKSGTNLLFVYRYYNNDTNPVLNLCKVDAGHDDQCAGARATVTGTFDEAGEEDRYTFTGAAGQRP